MNARVDHLVIVADTLEQGAHWCETTLGASPVAGGRHALMSTHNRLLAISGERFPNTYLELIAIDRDAAAPARPRWFNMDDPALQAAVREAPRFVHAVARTPMIEMVRWGLINCGLNPGVPIAAERDTPAGVLKWRITLRDDGRIECAGALPTLIEWQGPHPCDRLPASPVVLRELTLRGLPAQALDVLKLPAVRALPGGGASARGPALSATFDTPRGAVTLDSWT
ncbi:MAG TPA: VOC family protein [Burkholderiaceae bacterium]|nr:VOC family protein [Burkholderiaceae bacterium]